MPRPSLQQQAARSDSGGVAAASRLPSPIEPADPLGEAEAVRALLHEAQLRLSRLLAILKQQRRHSRALETALASLHQLRLDP